MPSVVFAARIQSAFRVSVSARCNPQFARLWAFALLVRSHFDRNALPSSQILQSGPFDGSDVNEHIAAAIIGLDEAVAAFSVEELDCSSHGHRETPPPYCSAPTRTSRIGRPDIHCRKLGHLG